MQFGLEHLIHPRLSALVDRSRVFYADRAQSRGPSNQEELHLARARTADPVPSSPPAVEELASHRGHSVPIRIHAPVGRAATGVLLDIHGGGFYLGSAAGSDLRNRRLANVLGIAVVSVDYRLAPANPWPAAPEDCETVALWLAAQADDRFGTANLAVCGFSAGATLTMTTLLRLRSQGITAFGAAVLQFGTYDLSGQTPAGRLIADEYFLQAYAGAAPDRTDPDVSPIYATLSDLSGLPPVLMVVGADDILLGDNLAMAAQLSAAEVDIDLRVYPAAPHGFTGHPTPMAQAALDDIDAWLADHLRSPLQTNVSPSGC